MHSDKGDSVKDAAVPKKDAPPHDALKGRLQQQADATEPPMTPASSVPKPVKVSPLQDLKNLEAAPAWRGCVDGFSEWNIRGWVFSTKNVMVPVSLDIYICGIHVTTTTSRYGRVDIDQIIGLPIKAGFQVSAQAISSETATRIFDALKALDKAEQPVENIVAVKIADSETILPFSNKVRSGKISVSTLLPILDAIVGTRLRNEYISVRDQLISRPSTYDANADAVKPIAFYLPQFHPFPENNEWWGEGFTEWTNVVGAKSFFSEHHQPHVPADFGYYDLRVEDVQRQQIDLAKRYGIQGFCYYYYWFSGKKLMTMPIDRHVEQKLDLDFCLCWANENWSRRWDGSESDVLMAQRHVEEDDVDFINSCIDYFKSERYIKVDGAPLLLVYRISLLQNPLNTIARWRQIVRSHGFPDLHVSMVESFGLNDPNSYGCNSSCQFPPHGVISPEINSKIKKLGFVDKGEPEQC